MKKYALPGILVLFSGALLAQAAVPVVVETAFAGRFPGAVYVEWEDVKDGIYEVDFEQDGKDMMTKFDADGNWVETEIEIAETNLPEAVWKAITTQFAGYSIDKVETESKPERELAYKVRLKRDDAEVKVTFSTEGEVLKKKEKSGY